LPADLPDPAPHLACGVPAGDDRALEALLAEHGEPCTLRQLAGALEWTLDRVLAAAARLEARLANTGQALERHGHHTLALRARANLIPHGATGRCHRQAPGPIDIASARVLYHILTANRIERTWEDLAAPDETDAAKRLLAAGLIEEHGSALQPTARCDATFNCSRRWEPPRLSALYGR
jgi:chromosome segregation and condensation protein ScpB